ncbi:septum formation family protein [Streptomyces sp. NPDC045431]|uniref:septum formation family protein n=1 Tax=Streptomyces sp. NPDC045431 TaxID=3155613 RepID=UPI0033EE94DA
MTRALGIRPAATLAVALAAAVIVSGCATTDATWDESAERPPTAGNPLEAMKGLPQGTPVPYGRLTPGTCSNHWGPVRADESVGTVDCAGPHVFEVVSKAVLREAASAPHPGERVLADRLRTACQAALDPLAAGAPGTRIRLHFMAYDKESWESGNRTGYCAITYPQPTRGSLGAAAGAGKTAAGQGTS